MRSVLLFLLRMSHIKKTFKWTPINILKKLTLFYHDFKGIIPNKEAFLQVRDFTQRVLLDYRIFSKENKF